MVLFGRFYLIEMFSCLPYATPCKSSCFSLVTLPKEMFLSEFVLGRRVPGLPGTLRSTVCFSTTFESTGEV